MNYKIRLFSWLLFALLSISPMMLFFAINGSFGDLYRAITSLFILNPITLVAGFLGYKYALEIRSEEDWKVLFRLGCIIAIKAAVFGGFLFMLFGIAYELLGYGSGSPVRELLGTYVIFLLGCIFLFWLILPVAGFGCIVIHKLIKKWRLVA